MNGTRVMVAILAVAVVVGGFSTGMLIGQLAAGDRSPAPIATLSPTPAQLPDTDAAGRDIDGLPRYPGSVRTAYQRDASAESVRVTAVYLAEAGRNDVRSFYVDAFHEFGWEFVDVSFVDGAWTFAVERGARLATVEIAGGPDLAEVRIEHTRALPDPTPELTPEPTPEPTPRVTPAPPPPPPPPDDDDGDDGDDDDGDDGDDDDSDDGPDGGDD
jgi:hypothetical protein